MESEEEATIHTQTKNYNNKKEVTFYLQIWKYEWNGWFLSETVIKNYWFKNSFETT